MFTDMKPPPEPVATEPPKLEITVEGQVATVRLGSESVTLDREGVLSAQRQLQRAAGDF